MKLIRYSIFFQLLLVASFSYSQEFWTVGTAKTVEHRNFDASLLRATHYGLTPTLEIAAHPVLFLALPHVNFKKTWYDGSFKIATIHGFHYPKFALSIIRDLKIGNLIHPDSLIPSIYAFRNEIIVSFLLKKKTSCTPPNYLLSIKLGNKFAFMNDSTLPVIDKPYLYQETAIYHPKQKLWYLGVDLDGHLTQSIDFSVDMELQTIDLISDWAVSHKGLLRIPVGERSTFTAGYWLSYGSYPTKNQFAIVPFIDYSWIIVRKNKKEMSLFKEKMF